MKKRFPLNVITLILLILFISFFLWQLKINLRIKQIRTEKSDELKKTEAEGRRLEQLKEQSQDLKQKEDSLYQIIPLNEKQPLGLIKQLISLGSEIGLKKVTFRTKEKKGLREGQFFGSSQTQPKPSPFQPLYLEMNSEGTFLQLLDFLARLNNLERIVYVNALEIKRSKEILPYQKFFLQLITYTFLQE